MKAPDLIQSQTVPAEVQLYGETFCREKNLDEWFGQMVRTLTEIKTLVCGEARPNWDVSPETTATRMRIADLCDIALGQNH